MAFIIIPLEFFSNPGWNDGHKFSEIEALLWLVRQQSFSDRKTRVLGKTYDLAAGEVILTYRRLAEQFGWSVGRVSRYIDRLTGDGVLRTSGDTGATRISFVDSPYYIRGRDTSATETDTPVDTTVDTPTGTNSNKDKPRKTKKNNNGSIKGDALVTSEKDDPDTLPTHKRSPNEIKVPVNSPDSKIYMLPERWESLQKQLGPECAYYLCADVTDFYKDKPKTFWKADHYDLIIRRYKYLSQSGKKYASKLVDGDGKRLPEGFYPYWMIDKFSRNGAAQ